MQTRLSAFTGVLIVLLLGCDSTIHTPVAESSSVQLGGMSDHSGILLHLIGTPSYQISNADGSFNDFAVPDGEYDVSIQYPYFTSVSLSRSFIAGRPEPPFHLDLKQEVVFKVTPDNAVVPVDHTGATFVQSELNLSDVPRTIGSYSSHWPFGITKVKGDWPAENCSFYGSIHVTPQGRPMVGSIEPGIEYGRSAHLLYWIYDLHRLGCLQNGEYFLFLAPTDATGENRRYFTLARDSLVTAADAVKLNTSLYLKHELFNPARIRIIN